MNNYKEAIKFLNNYRWSSHLDYMGKENFPSVTKRDFLLEFFNGHKGYELKLNQWLEDLGMRNVENITLE